MHQISAAPISTKVSGSGTGCTLVAVEKDVAAVVPSRLTARRTAKPLGLLVSTGIVPATFENILKENALPEVAVPLGKLSAGPNRLTSNVSIDPKVKSSKQSLNPLPLFNVTGAGRGPPARDPFDLKFRICAPAVCDTSGPGLKLKSSDPRVPAMEEVSTVTL